MRPDFQSHATDTTITRQLATLNVPTDTLNRQKIDRFRCLLTVIYIDTIKAL